MVLNLVCRYWGISFTTHKGATDCTRIGTTGCNGTGSTSGLKVWCLAGLFCGICGGTLSFCGTGSGLLLVLG